jgi:hypothetical protein
MFVKVLLFLSLKPLTHAVTHSQETTEPFFPVLDLSFCDIICFLFGSKKDLSSFLLSVREKRRSSMTVREKDDEFSFNLFLDSLCH